MKTEALINGIIEREGGYVDHPNDKGGPTKYGITLKTLRKYRRDESLTASDVKALEKGEAFAIYEMEYVIDPGFFRIESDDLKELVVDCGVLHGQPRASIFLQEAVNFVIGRNVLVVDGAAGSKTMAQVAVCDPDVLVSVISALRIRFIGKIVSRDHSQAVFVSGWLKRATKWLLEV